VPPAWQTKNQYAIGIAIAKIATYDLSHALVGVSDFKASVKPQHSFD
jgi:hypothetical protein